MKPRVTYPDAEIEVKDLLQGYPELSGFTSGRHLPDKWTTKFPLHLLVASDGEFLIQPVAARTTIRVVAWGATPTDTKRVAHLAQGLLLAEPHIKHLTGVLPAFDDDHKAELAGFTVRVTARSIPIP